MSTVKYNRGAALAVGTVMMVLLGLIYAWSIFVAPLEAEFGWTRAQTSMTFTVSISFFVIGLISNGFLSRRFAPRTLLLFAAAIMLAGFMLCSRVYSLPGLYISYGVLIGFAVGIANNALVSTVVMWFPGHTGKASGILMMGFGLGGMVLGSLATALMGVMGWRGTFMLFGVIFAVVIALGALIMRRPPQDKPAATGTPVDDRTQFTAGQVVCRGSFWIYILWFTLITGGGLFVIGHAAPFIRELMGTSVDAEKIAYTSAMFTGILSLCNGLGRLLTGIVYDKLGLRRSMTLTTLYLIAAAILLILANQIASLPLVFIGFMLTGLSYGGCPTTSSTFASEFYGRKNFAINYAIVSAGLIPGALFGPYLAGVMRTASGGYLTSFIVMLCFAAGGMIFVHLLRKP